MTHIDRFLDDLGDQLFAEQPARRRRRSWMPIAAVCAAGLLTAGALHASRDAEREAPPSAARAWSYPSIDRGPVPKRQLDALAVLRRPQTDADRSAPVQALLRRLDPRTHVGVRVDAIRLLADRNGWTIALVPMARRQSPDERTGLDDALCLMQSTPSGDVGETCGTTEDLRARGIGWPDPPFGLVADGIIAFEPRAGGDEPSRIAVKENVYDARTTVDER